MILNKIKTILEHEEFDCTLMPASELIPTEWLLVSLGLDPKKREKILKIIAAEQQLNPEFIISKATPLPYRIQFQVQLPFKVQDMALNQVASLLLFLNQFIDLPGFELNELDGQVLYRYVWIINLSSIDSTLISTILGAILLNIGIFSDTIESLAEGKISFNDLLTQVIKMAESPDTPPSFIPK